MSKKPQKRRRIEPTQRGAARVFRVRPDDEKPFTVEVRISRTRAQMRAEYGRIDGGKEDPRTMGMCRSWSTKVMHRPAIRPRGVVARIYLNAADLRRKPSEIVSHECAHAGMAWARLRRANLDKMVGEEVLCYAVGRLVAQVNRVCYASRAFG